MRINIASFFLLISCFLSYAFINCSVSIVTVENKTEKNIDSTRIRLISNTNYTFIERNILPGRKVVKSIKKSDFQLGHYLNISTMVYTKDSIYNGPEMSTDMVFDDGKYNIVINKTGGEIK